jgi:hypothetical protein
MTIVRLADPQDAEPLKRLNDLFNGEGCNSAENITASLLHNNQEIVCVASEGEAWWDSAVGRCSGPYAMKTTMQKSPSCLSGRNTGAGVLAPG